MTADYTIEATPGQVAAIERDGFLVTAGPRKPCPHMIDGYCMDISDGEPPCSGENGTACGGPGPLDCWNHTAVEGRCYRRICDSRHDHLCRVPVPTTKPCPECGGSGVELWVHPSMGAPPRETTCPTCNGDGTVPIVVEVVVPPRGHCPAGWAATTENVCNCTGGHYCVRPRGHDSKQHRCACGVTTTRQDALPSPDEEGPARTLLRGTAEAVPVVDDPDDVPGEPSVLSLTPMGRAIFWPEGESGPDGLIDTTHHFADVPRPEVGDTAWIIRGEG